jgi:NAD(P)H dehydrogenase (quinone)
MSATSEPTLLVTGAGGQFGRRVVELLLEAQASKPGAGRVIATTRNPTKLAPLAARGVEVRQADFDDAGSLAAAFAGADRLLLVSTDALDRPGARLSQHRNAVDAAVAAGVKHVVYTSGPAPQPTPGGSLMDDHFWTEQTLAASGLDWTILRDSLYADLLLMSLPHAAQTGQLFSATAGAGRSYVTREDCARVAAAVLASPPSGRRIFDVTGPAAVTQDEVAALAGEFSGRKVGHVDLRPDDLRQGLTAAGMPPFLVDALVGFDVAAAQGYHATVTPTVEALTGQAPTSVREFLSAHRSALLGAA